MIELSINSDFRDDVPSFESMEEQLALIAKAGFSHVHWCYDWEDSYIYAESEMDMFKTWLVKYNLKVKGLHGTEGDRKSRFENGEKVIIQKRKNTSTQRKDYTSLNEFSRLAGVDLIKNRIDLANKIGAQEVVLHMQMPYEDMAENQTFKAKYWQQVFKSFDELKSYALTKQVKIAVENLIWTPIDLQIEQFERLFQRYPADFLGLCYDSGHELLMAEKNQFKLLEKFKHRVIALHVNDNFGYEQIGKQQDDFKIVANDRHLPPFSGAIDWQTFAQLLSQSPYELPLTMELVVPRDYQGSSFDFLLEAKAKGERLTELVLEKGIKKG